MRSLIPAVLVLMIVGSQGRPASADNSEPGPVASKERVAQSPRGESRGKDKTCCGYPLVEEGQWALRFYWLAMEKRFDPVDEHVVIYTREGMFFGFYPEKFVKALLMEGSGVLADGRVVNYNGRCRFGVGTCYETLDEGTYPFGRGVGRRPLVPYKSVAVDPNLVPFGEPLYIPEFDGLLMPDGHVHDGCVRADDAGGNIKKRKMDFFVMSKANFRRLSAALNGVAWVTPHIEHPRCRYMTENRSNG